MYNFYFLRNHSWNTPGIEQPTPFGECETYFKVARFTYVAGV